MLKEIENNIGYKYNKLYPITYIIKNILYNQIFFDI